PPAWMVAAPVVPSPQAMKARKSVASEPTPPLKVATVAVDDWPMVAEKGTAVIDGPSTGDGPPLTVTATVGMSRLGRSGFEASAVLLLGQAARKTLLKIERAV